MQFHQNYNDNLTQLFKKAFEKVTAFKRLEKNIKNLKFPFYSHE